MTSAGAAKQRGPSRAGIGPADCNRERDRPRKILSRERLWTAKLSEVERVRRRCQGRRSVGQPLATASRKIVSFA